MSSEEQRIINEISRLTTKISNTNDKITAIDSETVPIECTELQTCLDMHKSTLEVLVSRMTARKSELEALLTMFTSGWTIQQQSIVDSINLDFPNTYTNQLDNLMTLNTTKKDDFFTLYEQATSTLQKQIIMTQFDFYEDSV